MTLQLRSIRLDRAIGALTTNAAIIFTPTGTILGATSKGQEQLIAIGETVFAGLLPDLIAIADSPNQITMETSNNIFRFTVLGMYAEGWYARISVPFSLAKETRAFMAFIKEFSVFDSVTRSLSRREQEIFNLLIGGLSSKAIANELNISPGTVDVHARSIYAKLGVSSRAQLISLAHAHGDT